jgi:hypothetical protein
MIYSAFRDDFEAIIRIFREDEGGRRSAPFNGIRWDLNYANEVPADGLYMIWPDFINDGVSLPTDKALPIDRHLQARMYVVVDEMRAQVHRARIEVGTCFYYCEGPHRVAEGKVTRITGLHVERVPAPAIDLSSDVRTHIQDLIRMDRRLDAVKAIRVATGVGLAEARTKVEEMAELLARR